MWISKTPLRVSFLGGGTDYPSYFQNNPGAVLGSTIDKYIYISVLPLAAFAEQKFRITYRTTESVDRVEDIAHPVVRETLKLLQWNTPLNIATMAELPGSTGLGSSSAFTVGFLNLLHHLKGSRLTRYELARQAIYLEQDVLKENVGVQDQVHAAFGGLSRYEFSKGRFTIEPVRISTSRLRIINDSMLLVYTGRTRSASSVVADQENRTASGLNDSYLSQMYELTNIGVQILEGGVDDHIAVRDFCSLLDQSWKLKRMLGRSVTSDTIDVLYSRGKDLGAWGGKLLGAGGGGFVLFFVDKRFHDSFYDEFGTENVVRVSLTTVGSTVTNYI